TSSPVFDLSISEVWGTLACGATVCVPPDGVVPDPGALLGWLAAEGVHYTCVPTILVKPLLEHPRPAGLALKTLSTGGDRCPLPPPGLPFEFVDYYGPSEASVAASWARLTSESAPSIGRPVENDQIYVLDRHFRPVPPGAFGEICIGGLGVARGYGRRSALTAERFIPHPLSEEPGARLYRSGDLGRHRADGRLEFLGRTDNQVKVRGFRIELGEIEALLGRHPAVREAVAVVRETAPGDLGIVAYWVATEEAAGAEDLRVFLRASLPDYMVPAVFCKLEELPRTATGKPDRKALPAPERAGAEGAFVAPRTPTEEALAALWQELLGLDRVGAEDHFFNLGGHSLLAVRLAARLRDRFKVSLSTQAVFEAPILSALAATVDRAVASGDLDETPALVARPRTVRQPRSGA
ncbi:MAG TPA: non-ribosomal peptide synthetase, partial [Thermoanaerobaculia bacterium]|nr:non-ribosomal peptide synthetase [Thermoanaerobaculia bacterium]